MLRFLHREYVDEKLPKSRPLVIPVKTGIQDGENQLSFRRQAGIRLVVTITFGMCIGSFI
jgi:hypothetical protein